MRPITIVATIAVTFILTATLIAAPESLFPDVDESTSRQPSLSSALNEFDNVLSSANQGEFDTLNANGEYNQHRIAELQQQLAEKQAYLDSLPDIVARRRHIAATILNGVAHCRIVSPAWTPPDSEPSYWFLRVRFNADTCAVDKHTYCDSLAAEGITVVADYRQIPAEGPWFRNRAGLGKSGFPWTCSDYKGPKQPQYKIDNALAAIASHFNISIHESYGDDEINDIIAAIEKLEKAYAK